MIPWTVGDGALIRITFTQPLTGVLTGNESHFTVSWQEYDRVPGGVLVQKSYSPDSTRAGESEYEIILEMAWNERFMNAVGTLRVQYDGGGTLQGNGGSVEPFDVSFTPIGLIPKPNQNDTEHIELSLFVTGMLTRIYYTNTQELEHIALAVSASGVLTHVDDL